MENYSMNRKNNPSVAILGLWHLGCVYLASLASVGFNVSGFDEDNKIIENLKKGIPSIFEPSCEAYLRKFSKKITFSSNFKDVIKNKDYLFVTYDIPVNKKDLVKLNIIESTFNLIADNISKKTIIVISSQVPIGMSRRLVNLLKNKGVKNPKVLYFPENLRLGTAFHSFLNPERVIIGSDNKEALLEFKRDFSFLNCPIMTMGLESAEMAKHALNCYLATCISLSSELSDISERTGANMMDVVKALKTDRRVSEYAPLNPGIGFSGGTLGRDIKTLIKVAKGKKYKTKLLNSVYLVNQDRLKIVLNKISSLLPSIKSRNIGILGLTYKPNTNTLRRSLSLDLSERIKILGGNIKAFDPAVKDKIGSHPYINICSDLTTFFKDLDLIILMTEWEEFRYINPKKLGKLMKNKAVIDTKNFLNPSSYLSNKFTYLGMGINR